MFNNIIYFIVVLLIFSINYPDKAPESSFLFFSIVFFLTWLIFAGYCRFGFRDLERQSNQRIHPAQDDAPLIGRYQGLIAKLSVLAIFLFALAVYLLNLKCWLQMIPGFKGFSSLQGLFALALFFFYLSTIWYFAYPSYKTIFKAGITRSSFIRSNLKLNIPILFPWMILSIVYDLLYLTRLSGPEGLLNNVGGQIIFFAVFLTLLMIFMPGMIQYWWGCKPLKASEKGEQLKAFLRERGFKYRYLLEWPIFEGRMMTAGIMGIVPRYRYILVTESLLEILSIEELKAVLAHEMGHAKYRHLLLYVLFFLGFMVISFGLSDIFFYLLALHPFFMKMIAGKDPQAISLFYLSLSVPMVMTLFVYFRYIMGFFMRNFERQADLYSVVAMGTSRPIISSLEKLAHASGKSRNLPSWHHFSIRERVDCLWQSLRDPGLIRRHNRFVAIWFSIYLVCMAGMGYFLNFSPMKGYLSYSLVRKVVTRELLNDPDNIALHQSLAMLCHEMGKYREAIKVYEKIIDLDPGQAVSLNNLAWLLVTAPDRDLRDEGRALDLAKRAVALKRSPEFLDTLAEAYYANGLVREALETIEQAIAIATKNRAYYEKQLQKFLTAS